MAVELKTLPPVEQEKKMDRRPPQQYAEDVDMIHYRRKDGQRVLVMCPIMWTNNEKLYNILMTYHQRLFIDYVLHIDGFTNIHNVCAYLGVPTFTGESYIQLVEQGFPTNVLVLYNNKDIQIGFTNIIKHLNIYLPTEYVEE